MCKLADEPIASHRWSSRAKLPYFPEFDDCAQRVGSTTTTTTTTTATTSACRAPSCVRFCACCCFYFSSSRFAQPAATARLSLADEHEEWTHRTSEREGTERAKRAGESEREKSKAIGKRARGEWMEHALLQTPARPALSLSLSSIVQLVGGGGRGAQTIRLANLKVAQQVATRVSPGLRARRRLAGSCDSSSLWPNKCELARPAQSGLAGGRLAARSLASREPRQQAGTHCVSRKAGAGGTRSLARSFTRRPGRLRLAGLAGLQGGRASKRAGLPTRQPAGPRACPPWQPAS